MRLSSPIVRVAFGIAMLTVTLLVTADMLFGLSTEGLAPQLEARTHLAEALAIHYSDLATREQYEAMEAAMKVLVARNPDVLSTAMRRADGSILAEGGDHRRYWRDLPQSESDDTYARIPIFNGAQRWGTLEIRFTELGTNSLGALVGSAWFKLLCFVLVAGSVAYFFYMRRTLRHLDPSAVIPARVRAAFDVLAEGVTFVDREGRIVMANRAFAVLVASRPDDLLGVSLGSLGWKSAIKDADGDGEPPWVLTLRSGKPQTGASMTLGDAASGRREFVVHSAPVLDDGDRARGAIVTFDDVTELEAKKHALERMVSDLEQSQDQIRQQNVKLEVMATRDALTNCLNRRSLMEALDREVATARRDGSELSCIMLDIDHFKSVNDTFGHVVGDAAIRFVASVVGEVTRGFDLVGRYGGEEFCVLLPTADAGVAYRVAERIREAVMNKSTSMCPEVNDRTLTISLGVATLDDDVATPMDLVDRADAALYVSKTSGRNRSTAADGSVGGAVTAA